MTSPLPAGRLIRKLIEDNGPLSGQTISCVSAFILSTKITCAPNIFDSLFDARHIKVVEPRHLPPRFLFSSHTEGERALAHLEIISNYFFLNPPREEDNVLAPMACDCCFDSRYLDYLASTLSLRQIGSRLIIRVNGEDIGMFEKTNAASPFWGWMKDLGFNLISLMRHSVTGTFLFRIISFQRSRRVDPDSIRRTLTSAVEWERSIFPSREIKAHKQAPALERIRRFEGLIPTFLEAGCSQY
ncbi:MAG: hypothetical protein ABIJ26_07515 [Candidatus Margulisiibacteriota bacterium]